jgi:hypothetical protein
MASPQRRSNRPRNIPPRFVQNDGGGEDGKIGPKPRTNPKPATFSQKKNSLPPVKVGQTLRETHLGKGTSGGTGDPDGDGSSSSSFSSRSRSSRGKSPPLWGDEISSDENPEDHGAPGGGGDPGDGDDDGGGDDSGDSDPTTPPGPTRPPPEIEGRIKELERQVSKLKAALKEIEQFCLSSDNALEESLFDEVVDVEKYITQQGPSMNKTELSWLKRYPRYYRAYSENCEGLVWLLEQAANILCAFIAQAKDKALFTENAEEAGKPSSRQAMALLRTTCRAIHQLLFILPELRTEDRKEWFSILNQNIDRWEKETAPSQRVVTPDGGRDANGFPLNTNQMHLGKLISELSKTVKETIKNGVTNSPGPVSCAQFVITTKHVIRDSMGRIEKIVAQPDIGQTLIAIAKKALTTLDAELDTDLLFAKDALEGHSSETAQIHSTLPEWLKWLKETFSTTQTLLAAAQKVLDAIENFPGLGTESREIHRNYLTGIKTIERAYREMAQHHHWITNSDEALAAVLKLYGQRTEGYSGSSPMLSHEHMARTILTRIGSEYNVSNETVAMWVNQFRYELNSMRSTEGTLGTRGRLRGAFRAFFTAISAETALEDEELVNLFSLGKNYSYGLIERVMGITIWNAIKPLDPILARARTVKKAASIHHLTGSVQELRVHDDSEDEESDEDEIKASFVNACLSSDVFLEEGDTDLSDFIVATVGRGAIGEVKVDDIGDQWLALNGVNEGSKEVNKCFCCGENHLLRECEKFKEKLQFLVTHIRSMRNDLAKKSPVTSEEEQKRLPGQIASAILTSLKKEMNDGQDSVNTNRYGSYRNRGGKFGSNRFGSDRRGNSRSQPFQRR